MLEWSIEALLAVPAVTQIVVALPSGASAPVGTIGVVGGAQRSQSVLNALRAGEGDPVIVHDAARALVTPEIFAAALRRAGPARRLRRGDRRGAGHRHDQGGG